MQGARPVTKEPTGGALSPQEKRAVPPRAVTPGLPASFAPSESPLPPLSGVSVLFQLSPPRTASSIRDLTILCTGSDSRGPTGSPRLPPLGAHFLSGAARKSLSFVLLSRPRPSRGWGQVHLDFTLGPPCCWHVTSGMQFAIYSKNNWALGSWGDLNSRDLLWKNAPLNESSPLRSEEP